MSRMQERSLDHLLIALLFGIVTSLVEVAIVEFRWNVLHHMVWTGIDTFWMAPLFYGIVFTALGMAAAVAALLLGRRWPPGMTAGLAAGLMTFSLLFLLFWFRLHVIALVLLSIGAGTQAGRFVHRHTGRILTLARRFVPPTAAVMLLVASAQPAIRAYRESQDLTGARTAPPGAPNILIIILDTVRAASLSLYGYARPTTPALERWAKRGVVFERAISTTSWTLPSHGSMFTGYFPPDLSTGWRRPLDGNRTTLAEVMHQAGYRTAGFAANLIYTTRESGLARGFVYYRDYKVSRAQFRLSTALGQWWDGIQRRYPPPRRANDRKIGAQVTRPFLAWAQRSDHPFFAFLNYYDAHQPYLAPHPWREQFRSSNERIDRYDASIAYLDHQVDTILTELDRRGTLQNTIVVVASDHGELLGAHGMLDHGNSLYDLLLHVPLVIWYPRTVPGNVRVTIPVTLRDLPATLIDLAGVPGAPLPGTSLRGAWETPATWRPSPLFSMIQKGSKTEPTEPISLGDMHSLYDGLIHYILNGDGSADLYDLTADPDELTNLVADPAWQSKRDSLDTALRTLADSSARTGGNAR